MQDLVDPAAADLCGDGDPSLAESRSVRLKDAAVPALATFGAHPLQPFKLRGEPPKNPESLPVLFHPRSVGGIMAKPETPGAGWYPAPGERNTQRYWTGSEWTEHRAPAGSDESALVPIVVGIAGILIVLAVLWALGVGTWITL